MKTMHCYNIHWMNKVRDTNKNVNLTVKRSCPTDERFVKLQIKIITQLTQTYVEFLSCQISGRCDDIRMMPVLSSSSVLLCLQETCYMLFLKVPRTASSDAVGVFNRSSMKRLCVV